MTGTPLMVGGVLCLLNAGLLVAMLQLLAR